MTSEPPHQQPTQQSLTLEPNDARYLANLCGQLDSHLHQFEKHMGIRISARGNQFLLEGAAANVAAGKELLIQLYAEICQGVGLTPESLHLHLQQEGMEHLAASTAQATAR